MKYAFITACLNLGLSVAKKANMEEVQALVRRLYPMTTEHPLIRLGSDGDGGYLLPDDLIGIAACFSPGVDNRATFEDAVIRRGIPCYLADASIANAPIQGAMVHFTRKFIDVFSSDETLTLDDWVRDLAPGIDDLLLQMDIEGAEWRVLLNVSEETLRRFRIINVELHDLERLMDKHSFIMIRAVFERLLQHFIVVHSHPNNYGGKVRCGSFVIPRVLELTLLRSDRAKDTRFTTTLPHLLDKPNDPGQPDLPLPRQWFHSHATGRHER